jgi:hypothetical protein
MESNGPSRCKFRNKKEKFCWIGHTPRKDDGEIPKAALQWNPQGNRKRGRSKSSWRRSVIKEAGEAGMKYGFWQLIEVERTRRQPKFLIGAMDSIIIVHNYPLILLL